MPESAQEKSQFLEEAQRKRAGVVAETWDFLKHNKKWWLLPIILSLLLFAVILVIAGGAAAPFIYTLF